MLQKMLTFSVLTLSSLLIFTACGSGSGPKRKSQAKPDVYFVKGNPEELLRGTIGETQSFLNTDQLSAYEDFGLRGFRLIQTKIPKKDQTNIRSRADLEAANSTAKQEQTVRGFESYRFVDKGSEVIYETSTPGFENYPRFRFQKQGNKLVFVGLEDIALKPLHYSLAADKRSFSILASYISPELGLELVALTFSRNPRSFGSRLLSGDTNFEYILGTGVEARWRKPVQLSICSESDPRVQDQLRASIQAWSLATQSPLGKIGSLTYQIEVAKIARPFNDLNQNCINLVRNYRVEDQEDYLELGNAFLTIDPETLEIMDSHVFLFADAQLKAGLSSILPTAIHEMGHVFGLGHEFRRNEVTGVTLHESVMGYEGVEEITSWDTQAILNLYPPENTGVFPGIRAR